jgi:Phytanoyl-CoA dioxygenase (PhyH)
MQRVPEPAPRALTDSEIEAFWRDGVICVRQLYSPKWQAELADGIEAILSMPSPITGGKREGTFHQDAFCWFTSDPLRDFAFYGPSADIAQQVFRSKKINFYYDQIFVKEQMSPNPTPWHHDFTFWPLQGAQIASLWTSLDTVNAESSALEFIAGSHRWPQRYRAIAADGTDLTTGAAMDELPDINGERDKFDIVSWDVEPGDALLFHALTLHGARGNRSAVTKRRAITTRWCGDDVTYLRKVIPEIYRHDLKSGDPLSGRIFPQILPAINQDDVAERLHGPIFPDPELLPAAMKQFSIADRVAVEVEDWAA